MRNNLNTAVIMNEFGKLSVDGQLINHPKVPIGEITEGCICCAMKSDVSQQLHELYLKYQPDIIFIECSGVAEPLARRCMLHARTCTFYHFKVWSE